MQRGSRLVAVALGCFLLTCGVGWAVLSRLLGDSRLPSPTKWIHDAVTPVPISKSEISQALNESIQSGAFPPELDLKRGNESRHAQVRYGLDLDSQAYMEKLIRSYSPDYAAFVALDATTGRLLSLISFTRRQNERGHLALKAIFPAASVFKVVTATAAVDQNMATPDTVIAFNGANHTLYRRNVTQTQINRWTRYMTLREAFAKSVNTVFGKLGAYYLDPTKIEEYARRFKFNENIVADVPVEQGTLSFKENDRWAMAEIASGYNRVSLMSPLQGALMAAAVANDGVMMEPYLVEELRAEGVEQPIYRVQPKSASVTMTAKTATEIRGLMRETVHTGTGRKSFRDLFRRRDFLGLEIGGKSGSLTGLNPKGKCDWFVGYAMINGRKIALAALTINERNWRVKSSYLARRYIETYFHPIMSSIRGISSDKTYARHGVTKRSRAARTPRS